jgi:hypothetical protein
MHATVRKLIQLLIFIQSIVIAFSVLNIFLAGIWVSMKSDKETIVASALLLLIPIVIIVMQIIAQIDIKKVQEELIKHEEDKTT